MLSPAYSQIDAQTFSAFSFSAADLLASNMMLSNISFKNLLEYINFASSSLEKSTASKSAENINMLLTAIRGHGCYINWLKLL